MKVSYTKPVVEVVEPGRVVLELTKEELDVLVIGVGGTNYKRFETGGHNSKDVYVIYKSLVDVQKHVR